MKTIDSKDIKHLANLSALEFTEEESKAFAEEFNNILKFVDQIATAKIDNIDTFARQVDISKLREDVAKQSYDQTELLKNAPKQRKGYFNVPKVVE